MLMYPVPRLRIFTLNGCIKKNDSLSVDVHYEGIPKPTRMKVHGESLAGDCPSKYGPAKPCFYVAHSFFADLVSPGGITRIIIHLGRRKVNLSVKEVNKRLENGITVCLQPVYYYSQWQNIVLYIEAWRAQGATRFIVFYHSSTKDTWKGLIELRSWPKFPSLPANIADKYPKVDDSVFIFSYFLAMNICILDIKTKFGTVADFDEVMVPRNGTLIELANEQMTDTNVGALSFGNNYVAMEPSIYSSNFSGVLSPIFSKKGGPSKYVFNASVIDIAEVHLIRSFINRTKITKNSGGALLHLRFGTIAEEKDRVDKDFQFFPDNGPNHVSNMQDTANSIFNGSIPIFSSRLIDGVNECVQKIRKKANTCRSTGGMCREHMDQLEEWVYDTTEGIFLAGEL
uniref:Glycosyltransferase family 92 protein n=1 Tax=Caenorhabditis tropicalis TaxID=1561998 RepID=A0A1I7V1X3_9PELO